MNFLVVKGSIYCQLRLYRDNGNGNCYIMIGYIGVIGYSRE